MLAATLATILMGDEVSNAPELSHDHDPFITEMVWVVGFCCFIFVYSLPLCLFGFQENPGFACIFMVVVNWFMKLVG